MSDGMGEVLLTILLNSSHTRIPAKYSTLPTALPQVIDGGTKLKTLAIDNRLNQCPKLVLVKLKSIYFQ